MHLSFSADRPVTLLASAGVAMHEAREPGSAPWLEAGSPTPPESGSIPAERRIEPESWRRHLEWAIETALVGEPDHLGDALTSDAVGWSPGWTFASRTEAEEKRRAHASSLAVNRFTVDHLWWSAPTAVAEWHIEAQHDAPLLVADELLVEASHHTVCLAGVSVARFADDRIAHLHTYYDDASVIEQVLAPHTTGQRSPARPE
jgi:hypothetical protein